LLWRSVPWKISEFPLTGVAPVQFSGVFQLPLAPPPFQMQVALVVTAIVPLVASLLASQARPTGGAGRLTLVNAPA